MPPWSSPQHVTSIAQGFPAPKTLSTPTPTSHTQYLGTLFENIYLSGRKEECVLSSSRLLTDASMELASRCHLCRARSSGSQGSSLPPLPLPTHSTSVTLLDNLYLSMRRDACVSSSSRLLTEAFMELASTRDLDRARSSGSKCPPPPQSPIQRLSYENLYLWRRRDECAF